jgi:GT2 family glycosyltransferase
MNGRNVTTFSVLICTYNRHELLAQCLAALLERTTEKPDQIVVVNGGDERADSVVEGHIGKQSTQVELVKTRNKNLAVSRNVGLPHCTGDIVAMTDDDAEVYPDWVGQMKRLHAEHPEAGAIGGAVIGVENDSLISRVADQVTFPVYPTARYVRTLPGVNISYKRTVIMQVGEQDETFFRGEDVDFNWRVKRLGYEIYFDPTIKVLHHHRSTLRGFLNQHYMYGRAYYLVRRKWQEMYCVYPHALRRGRDVAKALNFFVAVFYQPICGAGAMNKVSDKLFVIPLLFMVELVWRVGMFRQRMLTR